MQWLSVTSVSAGLVPGTVVCQGPLESQYGRACKKEDFQILDHCPTTDCGKSFD